MSTTTQTPRPLTPAAMAARHARFMPGNVPRYVRIYDNGGTDAPGGSCDRYSAIFVGRAARMGERNDGRPYAWPYLAMSGAPFHPQGIGQHGETKWQPADTIRPNGKGEGDGYRSAPAIGRKCHLGTRIPFSALPADCQRAVLQDYRAIWNC